MAETESTPTRRRVALNVRQLRHQLGWTQEEASERIGCNVQALRRIEGAKAAIDLDFLADIARALRVDLPVLVAPAGPWKAPLAGRPRSRRTSRKSTRRT